jgi:predicted AAA+ superfamily ATPase
MLPRPSLFASLQAALARAPVVALLGPRQCGKTTLARRLVPVASANYFDLEDPISLARLEEPLTALAELRGTVVIDEVRGDRSCSRSCGCWPTELMPRRAF